MIKTLEKIKNIVLNDEDYYELVHGAGLSAIFMIGGIVCSYILTTVSARWFGATGMGLLAILHTIMIFAGALAGLGVQGSVVRYINQRKAEGVAGRIRTLHLYIIRVVFPFSVLIAIILFLLRGWLANTIFHEPQLEQLLVYLAVAFPCIILGNIGLEMLRGYKDLTSYHSINKVAKILIRVGIVTIIAYYSNNIAGPAIALIIGSASGCLMMLPRLRKWYSSLPRAASISNNNIFKTSLPIMVTGISTVIMNQTDILMLGIYSDTTQVGIYQVAFRLAALVPFGLLVVNMIIGQKIAQLYYSHKKEKLQALLNIGTGISSIIGLVATLVFLFFAKQWMSIFGQEFIVGGLLLQILCIGQLVNAIAGSTGTYLNMTGRQRILQNAIVAATVLNIGLNILLIPTYGSEGAAYASVAALVCRNLYCLIYIKKHDNISVGIL